MRVLTVISGILISVCGAFCFAFNGNLFSSVAFVIGVTMVISGGCNIGAYLVSGRGHNRLTETTLVEGLVTLLYGVAVLNNQVTDSFLTMFFGTWLTVCGVTRVSQSFYVSRFNPRDWAKIIPLAAMASMLGVVMMMPTLLIAVTPLMLVGGAFIFDGLSMLTFAMYMKKRSTGAEAEVKAKERAEARKQVAKEQRDERDRLRKLSRKERAEELARQKKEKEEEDKAKKAALEAQKAERRQAARPEGERTVQIPEEQVAEINAIADANVNTIQNGEAGAVDEPTIPENPMAAIWQTMEKEEPQTRAAWQKPTAIPKFKQEVKDIPREFAKDDTLAKLELKAVKLDDIEDKSATVIFEKVELPEIKLASEEETADRTKILQDIGEATLEKEVVDYTPVTLEDLVREPVKKSFDPKEAKRFTQTLSFGWLEDNDNK